MIKHDSTTLSDHQKEIISHRVFATNLRGIFDKEYKNIEEVSNFTPKISINESYKYLKKFFNL